MSSNHTLSRTVRQILTDDMHQDLCILCHLRLWEAYRNSTEYTIKKNVQDSSTDGSDHQRYHTYSQTILPFSNQERLQSQATHFSTAHNANASRYLQTSNFSSSMITVCFLAQSKTTNVGVIRNCADFPIYIRGPKSNMTDGMSFTDVCDKLYLGGLQRNFSENLSSTS